MSEVDTQPPPENPSPETLSRDDAVIGRAVRGSAVALVLIGGIVGLVIYLTRPDDTPAPVDEKGLIPAALPEQQAVVPQIPFQDVTTAYGIDFVHESGARGGKLLPETMGSGVAIFDSDGDGDQDILLVNSTTWPGTTSDGGPPLTVLYQNQGEGRFLPLSPGNGFAEPFYGTGVAVGDYDNDGDVDVFIAAVGPNRLFRNEGGRFVDVTNNAGVAGDPDRWSSGCAFFDYDGDSHLDLFVCNYVKWSEEIDAAVNFQLTGVGRAYGPPTNFEGTQCYLYRNLGDGTFEDVSATAGIHVTHGATGQPVAKALAAAPFDYDGDGWIDLFVANDTVRNFLYHNLGNGTFEEVGELSGVAFDSEGLSTGAMGVDVVHYRNDSALALAVGNFANEMSSLYVSQDSPGFFTDQSITEGLGSPSRKMLTFGLFFFDSDLDGYLDLFQTNGHLEEEINIVQPSQHYRQPAQLFWNCGDPGGRCFVPADPSKSGDLSTPVVGRGAAYGDLDDDGDLDLIITQVGEPPLVLRNDQSLGHHWLRVRLVGKTCNRDAIGAWIVLKAGGAEQRRQVMPTRSYLSQVELPVTFGLGSAATVDSLEVHWPRGKVQTVPVPGVDRTIVVEQQ